MPHPHPFEETVGSTHSQKKGGQFWEKKAAKSTEEKKTGTWHTPLRWMSGYIIDNKKTSHFATSVVFPRN